MYSGCRGSDSFILFRCKTQSYANGGDDNSHGIKNQQPIENVAQHNTIYIQAFKSQMILCSLELSVLTCCRSLLCLLPLLLRGVTPPTGFSAFFFHLRCLSQLSSVISYVLPFSCFVALPICDIAKLYPFSRESPFSNGFPLFYYHASFPFHHTLHNILRWPKA